MRYELVVAGLRTGGLSAGKTLKYKN